MRKAALRKSVLQEVEELFARAARDPAQGKKWVTKARKKAMKVRLRLPVRFKRKFCRYCNAFFIPGKTVRIRTSKGKVVYTCFSCKKFRRFKYH